MFKVFIDGEAGTTGLQVRKRLNNHPDIKILSIDPEDRKNVDAKKALMKESDVTIICLPDEAAKESASSAKEAGTRVIDASSAHRTHKDWVYGLPELDPEQRDKIKEAQFVSNPGCHATGAILLLKPIIKSGLNIPFQIHSFSGYSGGGKSMIESYEDDSVSAQQKAYSLYGLDFNHKHIPEIVSYTTMFHRPIFLPTVVNADQGMMVKIAFHEPLVEDFILSNMIGDSENLGHAMSRLLDHYYQNEEHIRVHDLNELNDEGPTFQHFHRNNGTVNVDLSVYYQPEYEQSLLVAEYDNLGKGASGAAVQNLNIMLGLDEMTATQL